MPRTAAQRLERLEKSSIDGTVPIALGHADGSPTPKAEEMKREHGEEEPKGAESVTAPATVSGERPVSPLASQGREGAASSDPQVRRPAITDAACVGLSTRFGRGARSGASDGTAVLPARP